MMADITPVLERADANLPQSLERLFDLVRIKSISTDPAFKAECRKAAEWLVAELGTLGFEASVRDTPGHPMVVAHHAAEKADAPHLLFYGHYDVQPVDPLNLWETPPFEPSVKEVEPGRKIITGRGTADDKGQLMTFVEAVRAYKEARGVLPCRITILFEGEEESGSPSLKPFLEANAGELKADYALVCDTSMWDGRRPRFRQAAGPRRRGGRRQGGGPRPALRLFRWRGGEPDPHPGRDSRRPSRRDRPRDARRFLRRRRGDAGGDQGYVGNARPAAEKFLGEIGLSIPSGERGRSVLELTWARPTAEINGITGGYTGEGFKTVIAAEASAKVSFRLVGKQDPARIRESFRAYVRSKIPADCSVEFHAHGGSPAIHLPYDSALLTTAKAALSDEWPKPAVVIGMGGSIPIVGDFQRMLGMESLLVGFGLSDDRIHSPNEKYELTSFHKGIRSWVRILDALGTR